MPARREREATWRDRVRRWHESGLGRAEFAAEEGVHPSTLGWWRSELARRDAAQRAPVVALARVAVTPERSVPGVLELVLGRGPIVRVPAGFDAPTLERLLALLAEWR